MDIGKGSYIPDSALNPGGGFDKNRGFRFGRKPELFLLCKLVI